MWRRWQGKAAGTGLAVVITATTLLLSGCSGSGATMAIPPASLVAEGQQTFDCPMSTDECAHQGEAVNRSSVGCATEVRGVTRLIGPLNEVLATSRWELDPQRVIRTRERFEYEGCCLRFLHVMDSQTHSTELFWEDVLCDS